MENTPAPVASGASITEWTQRTPLYAIAEVLRAAYRALDASGQENMNGGPPAPLTVIKLVFAYFEMKIGFLNPWANAAENQAFRSLQIAAARIGHELVHCANSSEVDAQGPDFVLAAASTQPKLNDVPHYGVIHEPRDRFLTNRAYYHNFLSYDGYLTISDSLSSFVANLTFAAGRPETPGFYYNTCQRAEEAADLGGLIASRELKISYFGTNWDRRRDKLVNLLSQRDGVRIYGPKHSWPDVEARSYGGVLPFDGNSVQAKYAENGIGLCLLADLHLKDDVISNRIFEIASVGAIAICPEMMWLRRNFGDSVYYVDQSLPYKYLVQQILRRRDEIYANPVAAIEKARRARKIFEDRFAAEVLLGNAVEYHQRKSAKRQAMLETARTEYNPLISVIIRCGSRPLKTIERAVEAISRQTYGRFEIVFVRYRELDLSVFTSRRFPNIEGMQIVESGGGIRSTTLWAGLSAVRGEYFSVLDDDDWLFSNHFEMLFQPFGDTPRQQFFAYSGCIAAYPFHESIEGGQSENLRLNHFGIAGGGDFTTVAGAFASNCFVASSDLLTAPILQDPLMSTAEDSYLILSLLARTEPRFSFAGTSIHERGRADQSDFAQHPRRYEDELTLHMRLQGSHHTKFNFVDHYAMVSEFWSRRPDGSGRCPSSEDDGRIVHRAGESPLSSLPEDVLDRISAGFVVPKSNLHQTGEVVDSDVGSCVVETPAAPWSYGAEFALNIRTKRTDPALIKIRVTVENGVAGVGLLDRSEKHFLFRVPLKQSDKVQEIHIPVADIHDIGRVVVQNWDTDGKRRVRVLSLDVFTEALPDTAARRSSTPAPFGNGAQSSKSRTLTTARRIISAVRR